MNDERESLLEKIKVLFNKIDKISDFSDLDKIIYGMYCDEPDYSLYVDCFEVLVEVRDGEEYGEVCVYVYYKDLDFEDLITIHSVFEKEVNNKVLKQEI